VSLSDVASSILDAPLPEGVPILARRKGPARRIAEAKAEEREQGAVSKAKRALIEQPHQPLRGTAAVVANNAVLETQLRKIATRGVVQLFNAVRAAQKDDQDDEPNGRKAKRARLRNGEARDGAADAQQQSGRGAPANLSRDSFLDILRRGTGAAPTPREKTSASGRAANDAGGASGASFLRDDFMLGRSRAKDWDRGMDEDELEGYADDAHGADAEDEDEDE
jgi:hypothetical protein